MRKKRNRYRSAKVHRNGTLRNLIKTVFGLFALAIGVSLLSGALAHSYHALLEAPWLEVEEIRISGLKHLDRREILNVMQVPRHANALTLKMGRLAERLQSLPWLKSSVVRLDLPGRIVVEVTEREPMAVISAEETFLMDSEGKLFVKATREQSPNLPRVTGFSGKGLRGGSTLPREPLDAQRRLAAAMDKARDWLPPADISEWCWQGEDGFVLIAARKNIPIRLGTENFDQKLDRLRRIFQMLGDRQWSDLVTRIDLDYKHRAYVGGSFPHPKPPKPS